MRLIAVIAGLLLSTIALVADSQIITIKVNRSTGEVCVATPSGVISTKWCEDGDDGAGALAWAVIPDFLDNPEGTPFSVDLRQYLTEPGSPNATLTLVGSCSGWLVVGDDLEYSGTGVAACSLVVSADRSGVISNSLPFDVSAVVVDTGPECLTGFTCAAVDGATCDFEVPGANQQEITASVGGACTFTKTFTGEPNRHFVVRMFGTPSFNEQSFSGGGAFIARGSNWTGDYRSMVWCPQAGQVRFRTDANGAAVGQLGTAGVCTSRYMRLLYEASTDGLSGWDSSDNTTYTQAGATVDDGATSSGIYGGFVLSGTSANPVTITLEVVSDNTTLPINPPDPPGGPPPTGPFISNFEGGPDWPSGIGQPTGNFPSGVTAFENWIERDVDLVTAWCSQSQITTWANFSDGRCLGSPYVQNALNNYPPSTTIVLSWPGIPQSGGNDNCANNALWDQAAAGNFDDEYLAMATGLRNHLITKGRPANNPNVVMRLMWEMTGCWYPWSVGTKTVQFKQAWDRWIPIIRSQIPGMLFAFEPAHPKVWCSPGNPCSPAVSLETLLPDEDNYDFIGRSLHDKGPQTTSVAAFTTNHVNGSSGEIGLSDVLAAVIAHDKKMSFSEWSAQMVDCDPQDPASVNASAFLQGSFNFFDANSARMGYETYFYTSCHTFHNRSGADASILFKSLWE